MKLNSMFKGMVLAIPLLLTSCNGEEQITHDNKCRVVCSVDKFESEDLSRTNTDPENGFLITWASGDVIGIFPREGYQEPFEIPADQVGNKSANFDGGYWDVKDGLQYNAYYPFDKRNFDSADMKTKIPVTYVGQKQNGTSCDIGVFDYTYSDWVTAVDGKIKFDFHHIGAISMFSLKYPATTTYTQMTLSVDDALIPLEGSYDLTADEVAFVANESSMAESITLTLENCSGVAGETGVFYMMLPPMMDLSNSVVTLSLTSSAGTTCTYSIDKVLNTKSGKLYRRTGIPMDSKVEGTVDGWVEDEEDEIPYITFTAEAMQMLSMSKAVETLEYSVNDGEWKSLGTSSVVFGGDEGELRLRGKSSYGTSTNDYTYSQIEFSYNASVICKGDIRTLIDYENYAAVNTENARFCRLFYECSVLTEAPALPSMALADYCYSKMFYGCTGLTEAPLLPATTLKDGCYFYMFKDCVNLTKAPLLPAETLAVECYKGMFENCRSLIEAPSLPARQLARTCYSGMFYGCEKLIKAPALPAEILTESCYSKMFYGCKRLKEAPSLPATILAKYCYSYMFWGCEALTETPLLPSKELAIGCYNGMFMKCVSLIETPELPAKTLVGNCYSSMFWGCTNLNKVTMLATDIKASNCLNDWLYNVSSSGTITKAEEMSSLPSGASGVPTGWTVVDNEE